jgi:hypothetical protein
MQVWRATVLQTGQSDEQRTITGLAEDYAGLLNLSRATTRLPRSGLVQCCFSRVDYQFDRPLLLNTLREWDQPRQESESD